MTTICLPIGISFLVNAGYMTLVCLCQSAEDRIFTTNPEPVEKIDKVTRDIVKTLRTTRKTVIVVDWVATIGVLLLIQYGASMNRFCFDCKK